MVLEPRVFQECFKCIQKAAPGRGFILAPRGIIPKKVRFENIEAMYKAAEKYGRHV